jgi:hypothetical protein
MPKSKRTRRAKPRTPRIKHHKSSHDELTRLRNTFVRQLKALHTPEADRVLEIHRAMRANENNEPRTTLSQQVEVLGCRQWQQVLRCLVTGSSSTEHIKVCRRRFLCLNCHQWRLQAQVERWVMAIKQALRRHNTWMGPVVQLRWDIPGNDKRASLASFDKFMEQTFTSWLRDQGVHHGQWMVCRTFDPIQAAVRVIYLGPPITRDLWLKIYILISHKSLVIPISHKSLVIPPLESISHKSLVIPSKGHPTPSLPPSSSQNPQKPPKRGRGRGQRSPWLTQGASDFGEAYLINADDPKAGESDCFDRVLRSCLFWCAGGMDDLLRLQREQVWQVYARYNRTRLFSTRGLIYDDSVHRAHSEPSMLVDKQNRDGGVETVLRDPVRLLGCEEGELDGDGVEDLCPMCGKPKTAAGHELDGEPCEPCESESESGNVSENVGGGDDSDSESPLPTVH